MHPNKGHLETAPLVDAHAACPHYKDLAPEEPRHKLAPTAAPTEPGAEPMFPGTLKSPERFTRKTETMRWYRADAHEKALTTSGGVKIADNQNTLSAGSRGPLLLEDFHFQEKLAHFDRERIPERVVHARGSGAHGYFQVYESLSDITKADFLQDPSEKTPVFVRFSTVQGFRGSPDTVRDIRGFAVKFYTREGNFDIVGNDTPVFFIQDPIKFPDFVHAVKPEPHNEVPQGASAHDTLWDYVSLQPETLHNIMWAMSDRGIPRSYRTMEGFGIHTYRMVNAEGCSCFVRFHWKPLYGKASLLWEESNELMGRDPDFHRKDLWQAIEAGDFPEYELGLQIIAEEDAASFDFDILDATKLIPESLVPVRRIGRMVLDRNPDNFFTETEQSAFCPANIVPGIEFSDDPLLLGRTFSYVDTQRHRLGTPNFNELPINRPLAPAHNHQRDGRFRLQIDLGANYEPNSISGNWPREVPPAQGGTLSTPAPVEGVKIRQRAASFLDWYSQPRLFWLSQLPFEQRHIVNAFAFELSKVSRPYIRERVVDLLTRVDRQLAKGVAEKLGMELTEEQLSRPLPAPVNGIESDPALSLYAEGSHAVKGRRTAILVADGVSHASVEAMRRVLSEQGVHIQLLAPRMGNIRTEEGGLLTADDTISGSASVLFDAVAVAEGRESLETIAHCGKARHFLCQAYRHLKPIALPGAARDLLQAAGLAEDTHDKGLITGMNAVNAMPPFLEAMSRHREWEREGKAANVPA